MKYFLVFFLFSFSFFANAQSDSIPVKLAHIKQLFIDGTINEQEYSAMRAKVLGINAATAPTPIIIQQSASPTKQQIKSLALEEQHDRSAGSGCLIFAGVTVGIGAVVVGVGYGNAKRQINVYGRVDAPTFGAQVAGIILMNISLPLWIAGGVEIGKANHCKRQLDGAISKIRLDYSPTAMRLTF